MAKFKNAPVGTRVVVNNHGDFRAGVVVGHFSRHENGRTNRYTVVRYDTEEFVQVSARSVHLELNLDQAKAAYQAANPDPDPRKI